MLDYYGELGAIYGAGGAAYAIVPMGDPDFESDDRTTVLTTGAGALDGLTFTYAPGARTAFSLPTIYRGRGDVPWVPFNGINESLSTPDANAWSRNDAIGEGLTLGARVRFVNPASYVLISKWKGTGGSQQREWELEAEGDAKSYFLLYDESVDKQAFLNTNQAFVANREYLIAHSYDGGGGATAISGVTPYVDGAAVAHTDTENVDYVAMENTTAIVIIAAHIGGAGVLAKFFSGYMAGGPCGPFFTTATLTAQQHSLIDQIQRDALRNRGVIPMLRRMGRL